MISAKALAAPSVESMVRRDLGELAPPFAAAVRAALADCAADGLDAYVYEALRTDEVQRAYYARGRTVIPPTWTVTNARTAEGSWHAYGLAVDVISRARLWSVTGAWIRAVAAHFKRWGLDWGGDWRSPDLPHFQWGGIPASPPRELRELLRSAGRRAVWDQVECPAVVKLGARGPAVRLLQRRLRLGADGIFGERTDAAVRVFQAEQGLTIDGIVGPATWGRV